MFYLLYRLHYSLLRFICGQVRNFLPYSVWGEHANVNWLDLEVYYGCPIAELWWLVGFSEGDGTFAIIKDKSYTQEGGRRVTYIKYEYSFGLYGDDMELLLRLQAVLRGIGSIQDERKYNSKRNVVNYRLHKKSDIKSTLLPIFDTFPLLTGYQRARYLHFRGCLLSNIRHYYDLPPFMHPEPGYRPFTSIDHILSLPHFDAWLVGFINAEGYFGVDEVGTINTRSAYFSISQTGEPQIIEAIKVRLNISAQVRYIAIKDAYSITTNSIQGVSNVVNFMLNAPVKLRGIKHIQFIIWLINLTRLPRYKPHIKLPFDPLDY